MSFPCLLIHIIVYNQLCSSLINVKSNPFVNTSAITNHFTNCILHLSHRDISWCCRSTTKTYWFFPRQIDVLFADVHITYLILEKEMSLSFYSSKIRSFSGKPHVIFILLLPIYSYIWMELCYVVIFTIIINSAMIDKHIKNLGKVYEMGWEWPFCSGVVQNYGLFPWHGILMIIDLIDILMTVLPYL